jgi:hypothetical protein
MAPEKLQPQKVLYCAGKLNTDLAAHICGGTSTEEFYLVLCLSAAGCIGSRSLSSKRGRSMKFRFARLLVIKVLGAGTTQWLLVAMHLKRREKKSGAASDGVLSIGHMKVM